MYKQTSCGSEVYVVILSFDAKAVILLSLIYLYAVRFVNKNMFKPKPLLFLQAKNLFIHRWCVYPILY